MCTECTDVLSIYLNTSLSFSQIFDSSTTLCTFPEQCTLARRVDKSYLYAVMKASKSQSSSNLTIVGNPTALELMLLTNNHSVAFLKDLSWWYLYS